MARVAKPDTDRAKPRFYVETLGCPKNAVDSDKVIASLVSDGMVATNDVRAADLVVVNTCAFIEAARQESIDTALSLADAKRSDAKLVVTGCMAERYGTELTDALPEVDAVVGFSGEGSIASILGTASVTLLPTRRAPSGVRDLLELPRTAASAPWAYLKIAEGCDRACAFCAIPTFRGKQRSRTRDAIVAEAAALVAGGARELVLVAQDLAWYGRDLGFASRLVDVLRDVDQLRADGLARIRLLYLYPSEVRDELVDCMLELPSIVPYFDLSLQHAAPDLLRRMKRWGSGERFATMIADIRRRCPDAVFRSSFISGFPGETEDHHDQLLAFLESVALDWAGFFAYSAEVGTTAATLDGEIDAAIVRDRLAELAAMQEPITTAARVAMIGDEIDVLIDSVDDEGVIGRTFREAPEIDGVVRVESDQRVEPGTFVVATIVDLDGVDLLAKASNQ